MSSIPGDFLFGSTVYFEEVEGFGGVSVSVDWNSYLPPRGASSVTLTRYSQRF